MIMQAGADSAITPDQVIAIHKPARQRTKLSTVLVPGTICIVFDLPLRMKAMRVPVESGTQLEV